MCYESSTHGSGGSICGIPLGASVLTLSNDGLPYALILTRDNAIKIGGFSRYDGKLFDDEVTLRLRINYMADERGDFVAAVYWTHHHITGEYINVIGIESSTEEQARARLKVELKRLNRLAVIEWLGD